MNTDDQVRFIRSMVEHENSLLNQRMSWTFAAHAFLLAGAGAIWEKEPKVVILIGIVGIIASLSVWVSVREGVRALDELWKSWKKIQEEKLTPYGGPSPFPLESSPTTRFLSLLLPWNLLPWVLLIAWAGIVVKRVSCLT